MSINEPNPEKAPAFKWWHIVVVVVVVVVVAIYILGILAKLLSQLNADLLVTGVSFLLMFCCLLGIFKLIFFRSANSTLNK